MKASNMGMDIKVVGPCGEAMVTSDGTWITVKSALLDKVWRIATYDKAMQDLVAVHMQAALDGFAGAVEDIVPYKNILAMLTTKRTRDHS